MINKSTGILICRSTIIKKRVFFKLHILFHHCGKNTPIASSIEKRAVKNSVLWVYIYVRVQRKIMSGKLLLYRKILIYPISAVIFKWFETFFFSTGTYAPYTKEWIKEKWANDTLIILMYLCILLQVICYRVYILLRGQAAAATK